MHVVGRVGVVGAGQDCWLIDGTYTRDAVAEAEERICALERWWRTHNARDAVSPLGLILGEDHSSQVS